MVRRSAGAVLLLTVVLVTMIASRWLGAGLPGRALAGPPPPPPEVGECLQQRAATVDLTGDQEQQPFTADCAGDRSGEVVFVGAADAALCVEKVNIFLGLGADGGYLGGGPVWSPPRAFGTVLMGPSAAQQLAGQDWSACAVVPTAAGLVPSYPQSVHRVYRGAVPLAGGGCALTTEPLAEAVPCDEPHRVEWFGLTEQVAAQTDLDRIRKECRTVLENQLGTDDPTRDGLLTMVVPTYVLGDHGPVELWWSNSGEVGASCGVQPADRGQLLVGTLRGLGDGEVPLVAS